MGMFDKIIVKEGFKYRGKTYKHFQTKDFDNILETYTFGERIISEQIPSNRIFTFYGFAEEEEKQYSLMLKTAKRKYKDEMFSVKYFSETRKKDKRKLIDFTGVIDINNVFFMILSQKRKKILKELKEDKKPGMVNLHGWDDGKIYFYREKGGEYCVSDDKALIQILSYICLDWISNPKQKTK